MNTRRRIKWVFGIGLLCWSAVACGGSTDVEFVGGDGGSSGDGGSGADGGSGGDGGSGATGGSGGSGGGAGGGDTGGTGGGGTGGSGGSAGASTDGEVGAGQGFALAPGGNVMSSDNNTLILTTGESPEGNTIMSSDNYRLQSGLVGVTER